MNPIVWQQGSSQPDNATMFATISQWWTALDGKEIRWQQRLIPASGNVNDLDWEPQRFDETFLISSPAIRGITLFWRKPDAKDDRSVLLHKLQFDSLRQQLYIFPQTQKDVVIRVALPQVVYQQMKLSNPQVSVNGSRLTFRDEAQQVEVVVTLSSEGLAQLKQYLA